MPVRKHYIKTAELIRNILTEGFLLTPSDLHFLESSWSVTDPAGLSELIDNGEGDILTNLVVSPDSVIQERFELLLCDARFCENDSAIIAGMTSERQSQTTIRFPGNDERVIAETDRASLEQFIRRLRIGKNPPETLYKNRQIPEDLRVKILVRLRNSPIVFCDSVNRTLNFFFGDAPSFRPGFMKIFDYFLSVIEERQPSVESSLTDIKEIFLAKREALKKSIGLLDQAEKKLRSGAVETMMLEGNRFPPFSREDLLNRLEMTKKIIRVIFFAPEKTEPPLPEDRDYGCIKEKKDIDRVFRLFS